MNQSPVSGEGLIVGIGDLAADLVIQIPKFPFNAGRVHVTQDFRIEPGGTANFLILAARLQAQAAGLGSLGADMWGREVKRLLLTEQIDLDCVHAFGKTSTVLVMIDEQGQHAFVGKFGSGTEQGFTAADKALIDRAAVLFTSGYTLQEPNLADIALKAFQSVSGKQVWRLFDPGPMFAHVEEQVRASMLAETDILLLTEEEVPLASVDGLPGLFAQGPEYVVVKRGERGCVVHKADSVVCDFGGHAVDVLDTTAAGDSFAAGFAVGLVRGWSLTDCAALANAVGAAKVQKVGSGRSVPTLKEVRAVIERFDVPIEL